MLQRLFCRLGTVLSAVLLSIRAVASGQLPLLDRAKCEDEPAVAVTRDGHLDASGTGLNASHDTSHDHCPGFGTFVLIYIRHDI